MVRGVHSLSRWVQGTAAAQLNSMLYISQKAYRTATASIGSRREQQETEYQGQPGPPCATLHQCPWMEEDRLLAVAWMEGLARPRFTAVG